MFVECWLECQQKQKQNSPGYLFAASGAAMLLVYFVAFSLHSSYQSRSCTKSNIPAIFYVVGKDAFVGLGKSRACMC